jgi:uncharacterized membrane protein
MNWILGLVGAFLGVALSDSREALGLVLGFLVAFLLSSNWRLRRRVEEVSADVKTLRAQSAAHWAAQFGAGASRASDASQPATAHSVPRPADVVPPAAAPSGSPPAAEAARNGSVASAPAAAPDAMPAAASAAPANSAPPPPAAPPRPREPAWFERALALAKSWFTEGNVPVKLGVLVLLFGVAAALRYAAAQGYFVLPIEARLAVVAAVALLGLGLGWRERQRRPAFGLAVQGGAIGVLLLTVFAAFRLYGLLPPMLALALVVVLVAGAAMLAVLQQAMWLAVLGFLGGYLAPVLISTGSGNHVALFSYYAVLNAAVFAISWKHSWRLLNLLGFFFTFGVGLAWGEAYYRPELFASVEAFLVLFFAFYILIGLVYVLRQSEHRRPWVDGTLVFGTPLVAFPMQAYLLRDDRLALAFSALVVAVVYAALVWFLRRRRGERLLTEAYGALALGFATLAVPLAFSASTTASVWALEGAGVAWLGLRQGRKFPWLAGLALQPLAAVSYLVSLDRAVVDMQALPPLLLNGAWLGAAMLAFAGFALARIHDRHHPRHGLPALLFGWAVLWWAIGGIGQADMAEHSIGSWVFVGAYLAVTIATAALLRLRLDWPRLDWLLAIAALSGIALALGAEDAHGAAFTRETLPVWAVFFAASAWALWSTREDSTRALHIAHLAVLWTAVIAVSLQGLALTRGDAQHAAMGDGWRFLCVAAPLGLVSLGLSRRPGVFGWPRAQEFAAPRWGWFAPALVLLAVALLVGAFLPGDSAPLAWLPVLNPLELALLGIAALLYHLLRAAAPLRAIRTGWPLVAFALVSLATLRAVHQFTGAPWSPNILSSDVAQASLTVVWSLLGVGAWIVGSRRRDLRVWLGGAVLMGIVMLKLWAVDRDYMGNLPGIVSFLAVGLLLVVVGYIAPKPPRSADVNDAPEAA